MKRVSLLAFFLSLGVSLCAQEKIEQIELAQLNTSAIEQGVLQSAVNRSMTGERMRIAGQVFPTGISVHAPATGHLYLGGNGKRFRATVGVDDVRNRRPNAQNIDMLVGTDGVKTFFYALDPGSTRRLVGVGGSLESIQPGSVEFILLGDGKQLWSSGVMKQGDAPKEVNVDISGVQLLKFSVTDGGDGISGDVANWANVLVEAVPGTPVQIVPSDYLLVLNRNESHFQQQLKPSLQKLPKYTAMVAPQDWLVQKPTVPADIFVKGDRQIVLSNGLVSRTIHVVPNATTISLKNMRTGEEFIRSVQPEALVTIDSIEYAVGGLSGQVDKGYLLEEWLSKMYSPANAFTLDRFIVKDIAEKIDWKKKRWAPATQWRTRGKELVMYFHHPSFPEMTIEVHHEIFDNIPLLSKWIVVTNKGSRSVQLNEFSSEIIAHPETENHVAVPKEWKRPNIHIENEYIFGGFTFEEGNQAIAWEPDPEYTSQSNYEMVMPCILKSKPLLGPNVSLQNGVSFTSFRTYILPLDGTDRERNTLAQRKMYRTLAPWVTENPIFLHLTSTQPEVVKTAIDQCVETGYEMVILSFGSGLNMEDQSEANLNKFKELADYAHSRGIAIGGYSLLSSRKISDEHDVINVKTGKPGGAIFGNAPCLGSKWGIEYLEKLKNFFERTGFDILEHDGSYPGDFCASTSHPGHDGYYDSQWKQWRQITDFYKWLRARGVYMNIPDFYILSGSNKTAIGYREVNWSLPRAQQLVLGRQNIYDGTWTRTPSMGWTFVPLVQYHGGGAAATLEPLSEHLDAYAAHMEQNYGAGVQACYRGNRLYDTDATKKLVQHKIKHYLQYREILNADIIHLRRPTGRDWDGFLHVDPSLQQKGYALLFNPTDNDMEIKVKLPLYYTGLQSRASIQVAGGSPRIIQLDEQREAEVLIKLPAKGNTWIVIEEAGKSAQKRR